MQFHSFVTERFFPVGSFSSPGAKADFLSHSPEHQRSIFTWELSAEHVVTRTSLTHADHRWPMGPQHRSGNHRVNTQLLDSSIPPSPSRTSDPPPPLGTWPSSLCSPHYKGMISLSSSPARRPGPIPSLMLVWGCPQRLPTATTTHPGDPAWTLVYLPVYIKGTGCSHQGRKRQACCHSRGLSENKGSTGPGII